MSTPLASSNPRNTAEQVRLDYRTAREQARQSRLDEYATRKNTNQPLQPVEVKDMVHPDGTLARKALDSDLEVTIPSWQLLPEDGDTEYVYLQLSKTGDTESGYQDVAFETFNGPTDGSIFPYPMHIPQNELPANGTVHVRYRHINFVGQPTFSTPRSLICDSLPPWGRDAQPEGVLFTALVIDDSNLGAGVQGTLPVDPHAGEGDTYELYFLDRWPEEGDDFDNPVDKGIVPTDRSVVIPAHHFTYNGDGKYHVAYYLWDRAGNKSRLSLPITLNVVLGDLPDNLKLPTVPLAQRDNLIDLKDAIQGVTVEIDRYEHARENDRVVVRWGNSVLAPETVGVKDKITVHVPNPVLRREFGTAAGPLTTTVSYQVLRGEVPFPAAPLSVAVEVDFSVVGPERPDPDDRWPNPVNDQLVAPTIRGKVSNTDNVLTRADKEQDATLTFAHYQNILSGQYVDFYWDDVRVSEKEYEVDTNDPDPISIDIPWKYILQAGNKPDVKVYYTVRADIAALNEQYSVPQSVNVDAIELILPLPGYEGIENNWLNCGSLADPANPGAPLSLRVKIPDLSNDLKVGDRVTMHWEPWIGSSDNDGSRPVPGAAESKTITLDPDNIGGFTWHIEPYAERLLPTFNPSVSIRARARFRYAKEDDSITSDWAVQRLSLASGSSSCPLPPLRKP
ncbi:hypothetical protein V7V80_17110 [Pseudomonas kermanshahensis]|uniref:Uncharacterized protein n=1 Tax=Pseudomonas kermanshahensis TaxID=2745482 RepID=A0ABU8R989_9PSED|nr:MULTISPECIES: hypothetical protein [Pseudomonas]MBC3486262.1 hypothetical protein [Pseudomonas sp. SWRI50]MBC3498035.1 hypothetical protein [Pseudomonas sp. SWRI67]MBV4525566.1 hypothetical protein [Pseudomonas kermanshahensis]